MSLLLNLKKRFDRLNDRDFATWLKNGEIQARHLQTAIWFLTMGVSISLLTPTYFTFHLLPIATLGVLIYALLAASTLRHFIFQISAMNTLLLTTGIAKVLIEDRAFDIQLIFFAFGSLIAIVFYASKLSDLHLRYLLELRFEAKAKQVHSLTRDLRAIVEGMSEGLYLFTREGPGTLSMDALQSCIIPHGREARNTVEAASFDTLFMNTDMSPEELSSMHSLLLECLGDTILKWDFNAPSLPKTLRIQVDLVSHVLETRWSAIRDDEGIVQKIMLNLSDVTEVRQLQEDSKARNEDAKRLMELISNSPKKIGEFFAMTETFLREGKSGTLATEESTILSFRNIHTLKGMARGYQLEELSQCLSSLESVLQSQSVISGKSLHNLPAFLACEVALRNYRGLFQRVYTRQNSHHYVSTDPKVVLALTEQIEAAYMRSDMAMALGALNEIRAIFACTLDKIIIDEISMLRKLADDLSKPHPNLYINELDIQLSEEGKIAIRKVFVHLFRNSIDHGIETEEERLGKGKPDRGQISIHIGLEREFYRITYTDDGQGLALPRILKKAQELGITDTDRLYTEQETAELIFQPGLSTASQLNTISGRGVGMDAIRSFLRQEGGNISIQLGKEVESDRRPFSFLIDIPLRRTETKPEPIKRVG